MTVNTPAPAWLTQVGTNILTLRDALNDLINANIYLTALGGVSMLTQPPFNLAEGDAQNVVNLLGEVTASNPTVEAVQGFVDSAAFMWGNS